MLSSVFNSEQAILVNIAIIRTFVRLRQLLATHEDLAGVSNNWNGVRQSRKVEFNTFSRLSST